MQQLGIYCGTFNPIHNGHLLIAECARDQFGLEKVFFITSARPPHRRFDLLDAQARHELVCAAIADNHKFESSDIEIMREGPSYTVDTIKSFQKLFPEYQLNLIIGGDNLRSIGEWHEAQSLIQNCRFLVAPRLVYEHALITHSVNADEAACLATVQDRSAPEYYDIPGATVLVIDFPAVSISSSLVRTRLKEGRSVLYMVPSPVNELLLKRKHYL